jgi:hypothetical protein
MQRAQAKFKSDPRTSCAIVARSVLAQLENEQIKEAGLVYVTTLVRLLDSYRVGGIVGHGSHGVLRYAPLSAGEDFAAPRNASEVQAAFNEAHQSVFPRLTNDQLVNDISTSLKNLMSIENRQDAHDLVSREKLKLFLSAFEHALSKETVNAES